MFNFIFCLALTFYLATNLQWYDYKFKRVILNHHKISWHFYYFVAPVLAFSIAHFLNPVIKIFSLAILNFAYIIALVVWHIKLDKRLVFTKRVFRLFAFVIAFLIFSFYFAPNLFYLALVLAFVCSEVLEQLLLRRYKRLAKAKLKSMRELEIIAITASFGKTSIKNFLHQILQKAFKTYATPKSVNTLKGILLDINKNLPSDSKFYIAELGARMKGDILEITQVLEHEHAILGEIGAQHIEYFKSFKNVVKTKSEILQSNNLKTLILHEKNALNPISKCETTTYPQGLSNIRCSLNGSCFTLKINGKKHDFNTPILGEINVENITACIFMALKLGLDIEHIKQAVSNLNPVDHRLQKICVGGKIIIDDSFNGNLRGMLCAFDLCAQYEGRRIVITPGLVESNIEQNETIATKINDTFDMAIITGELNSNTLSNIIKKPQKTILKEKSQLENILRSATKEGDLILFANDAPNFI